MKDPGFREFAQHYDKEYYDELMSKNILQRFGEWWNEFKTLLTIEKATLIIICFLFFLPKKEISKNSYQEKKQVHYYATRKLTA
jgi:hypothetical protein